MRVTVEAHGEARLEEPEDLKSLSVVTSLSADALAARVREIALGRPDPPGHVWLVPAALVALAGPRDEGWTEGFAAMVAYADSKGWVDASGRVRAHVERASG